MNGIGFLPRQECAGKDFEFFKIFAASLAAFDVFLKLLGVDGGVHQMPSLWNMSSASLQTMRLRPASESAKVRWVVGVGTTTSKGSPFRSLTCL